MSRFVTSVLAAVILYTVLEAVFGPAGVLAYQDAHAYRQELEVHIADLREQEAGLSERISGLQRDEELIRVAARSLGLIEQGERLLRIEGYQAPSQPTSAGTQMESLAPFPDRRPLLRGIAAGFMLGLYLLLLVTDLAGGRRNTQSPAAASKAPAREPAPSSERVPEPQTRSAMPDTSRAGAGIYGASRALSGQRPERPTFEDLAEDLADDIEPIELPGLPYSSASPVHAQERRPFAVVPRAEEQ